MSTSEEMRKWYIPGVDNWSNGLTKPETAEQLNAEAEIYQVQVTP
jgi:hypothetical protein